MATAPSLSVRHACQVFKALADEPRLRLLTLLAGRGELNVAALVEGVGMTKPAVSHHLTLLRMAGVITPRRQGKRVFYSLADGPARHFLGLVRA